MPTTCCWTNFSRQQCLSASTIWWGWKNRHLQVSPASQTLHKCLSAFTSQGPPPCILLLRPLLPLAPSEMSLHPKSPAPEKGQLLRKLQGLPAPAHLLPPSMAFLVCPASHLLKSHAPAPGSPMLLSKLLHLHPLCRPQLPHPIRPPRHQSLNSAGW